MHQKVEAEDGTAVRMHKRERGYDGEKKVLEACGSLRHSQMER